MMERQSVVYIQFDDVSHFNHPFGKLAMGVVADSTGGADTLFAANSVILNGSLSISSSISVKVFFVVRTGCLAY